MLNSPKREKDRLSDSLKSKHAEIDLKSIEAAIEKWGDTVFRLAVCKLRNWADAEDVFQTVFLKLYLAKPCFSSAEHQKAWLLRVACNCCNDLFRYRTKHDTAVCNSPNFETAGLSRANSLNEAPIDETFSAADEFREALSQLSDLQRTCIYLRYFEGYTSKEISEITGEKPSTIRSHLYRAKAILRDSLEGDNS